jgi:hypothetical protein
VGQCPAPAGHHRDPLPYRRHGQDHDHAGAFAALAATLPIGSVAVAPERALDGGVGIWLDHAKLKAARGPGESYSDVILALAEAHAGR